MTRKDLAKILAKKTGLSQIKAEKLIINFGKCIEETLARGEKIVYSNFGTFYTVHYPSKIIYHPKLGKSKKMVMLPTNAVKWMPSGNIKEMVRDEIAVENATKHGAKKSKPNDIHKNEVEIPIKKEVSATRPIEIDKDKIYEEAVKGGGKEVSTFEGAIRVNRDKSTFLGRIFGRKKAEIPSPSNLDALKMEDSTKAELSGEKRIDDIKSEIKRFHFHHASDIEDIGDRNIREEDTEIEITPFKNKEAVSYVNLKNCNIDKGLLKLVPKKIAREYKAVPIEEKNSTLVIAMVDPNDYEAKEVIKRLANKNIVAKLATEDDINSIISWYESDDPETIKPLKTIQKYVSDNAPAARILTAILRRAARDKASDIHLIPKQEEVEIKFRVDGKLVKKTSLPSEYSTTLASRIKIISGMDSGIKLSPQNGRFSARIEGKDLEFITSTMPASDGERIAIKVIDKTSSIASLSEIGMSKNIQQLVENALKRKGGIILITGPAKSGKTITLYSLIKKSCHEGVNILTIEDPIAYKIEGITQSQVNEEKNYDYFSGLSSIVRQDPDTIVVGEITDKDTAELAAQTALNGHLILTTIKAENVLEAIKRLVDNAKVPSLLLSGLGLVIGQKLVDRICPHCKTKIKISDDLKKKVREIANTFPGSMKNQIKREEAGFCQGKGCEYCEHTGKKGQVSVFEALEIDKETKGMFLAGKPAKDFQKQMEETGALMVQDALLKAILGQITLEDALKLSK